MREVARGNWNQFFSGAADPANYDFDLALHSMTPSADVTRTYLAYLRGGFGILDTWLYVLRYTGPRADEVRAIGFLEGNSNLRDALTLAADSLE